MATHLSDFGVPHQVWTSYVNGPKGRIVVGASQQRGKKGRGKEYLGTQLGGITWQFRASMFFMYALYVASLFKDNNSS